ncbi:hypothetical protein ADUPG1_012370 [Aduncisulcus paluster]|uniref:ER membrane protein complex subunit 1 n=1 Tax=Aduncisulcus paluster TaxID=2918883 RepID=A0ABQ5K000_9EUKA|nr:hypothetical protein ADUPG1_012370 [Aduncisulcus paluster]
MQESRRLGITDDEEDSDDIEVPFEVIEHLPRELDPAIQSRFKPQVVNIVLTPTGYDSSYSYPHLVTPFGSNLEFTFLGHLYSSLVYSGDESSGFSNFYSTRTQNEVHNIMSSDVLSNPIDGERGQFQWMLKLPVEGILRDMYVTSVPSHAEYDPKSAIRMSDTTSIFAPSKVANQLFILSSYLDVVCVQDTLSLLWTKNLVSHYEEALEGSNSLFGYRITASAASVVPFRSAIRVREGAEEEENQPSEEVLQAIEAEKIGYLEFTPERLEQAVALAEDGLVATVVTSASFPKIHGRDNDEPDLADAELPQHVFKHHFIGMNAQKGEIVWKTTAKVPKRYGLTILATKTVLEQGTHAMAHSISQKQANELYDLLKRLVFSPSYRSLEKKHGEHSSFLSLYLNLDNTGGMKEKDRLDVADSLCLFTPTHFTLLTAHTGEELMTLVHSPAVTIGPAPSERPRIFYIAKMSLRDMQKLTEEYGADEEEEEEGGENGNNTGSSSKLSGRVSADKDTYILVGLDLVQGNATSNATDSVTQYLPLATAILTKRVFAVPLPNSNHRGNRWSKYIPRISPRPLENKKVSKPPSTIRYSDNDAEDRRIKQSKAQTRPDPILPPPLLVFDPSISSTSISFPDVVIVTPYFDVVCVNVDGDILWTHTLNTESGRVSSGSGDDYDDTDIFDDDLFWDEEEDEDEDDVFSSYSSTGYVAPITITLSAHHYTSSNTAIVVDMDGMMSVLDSKTGELLLNTDRPLDSESIWTVDEESEEQDSQYGSGAVFFANVGQDYGVKTMFVTSPYTNVMDAFHPIVVRTTTLSVLITGVLIVMMSLATLFVVLPEPKKKKE